MTDPTRRPEHAAYREQEPAPDPEVLQLAAKIFNLARQGGTDILATYVDAGVPANLCNDRGDTLVMLAAYHGHPQTVAALLERGADPVRRRDRPDVRPGRSGRALRGPLTDATLPGGPVQLANWARIGTAY